MNIQNLAGQILGQYELQELLGFGGMGVVYRAQQTSLERQVAVKVLTPALANEPGYIERFYREAKTAAALEHAHIVPVYDYGVQGDISYVVMRMLTGGTLEQRAQQRLEAKRPLPSMGEISALLGQLARALDYAHSQGVIHRDIKPANIMFDEQGNSYIMDFGIAKLMETTTAFTASGVPMGTPIFMPPEQWRSEDLTPAADQYALGVTIYALVTGGFLPFDATTPYGMMHKHINEPPTPPQTHRADLPASIGTVLQRALAKKPADRYPTCADFSHAFTETVQGQTGELTNFFTMPVLHKPISVPGGTGTAPAASIQQPKPETITVTVTKPVYKSPVTWVLTVALILVVVVLVMVAGGGEDTQPEETLSAAQVQQTIDAEIDMQLATGTSIAKSTQTQAVEVAIGQTGTATAGIPLTQTQNAVVVATQAMGIAQTANAIAATSTQHAYNQTATAEAQSAVAQTVEAIETTNAVLVATGTQEAANVQATKAQNTAEAAQGVQATQTADAANRNATATQLALDLTEVYEVRSAQSTQTAAAATATQQWIVDQTATADSASPTPETTPTPTPSITPTPTPRPNVRAVYSANEFLLVNISNQVIDISKVVFEQGDDRSFAANLWGESQAAESPARMPPQKCYQLFTAAVTERVPDPDVCVSRLGWFSTSIESSHFWIAERPGAVFTVYGAGGDILATCQIAAGECTFYVPQP